MGEDQDTQANKKQLLHNAVHDLSFVGVEELMKSTFFLQRQEINSLKPVAELL